MAEITESSFHLSEKYVSVSKLLPKSTHIIKFVLDTNISLANGIRRTLIEEMKVKALDADFKDIDTNEPFMKLDEFRDRIRAIPIDQNTPLDKIFKIDVVNSQIETDRMIIHSGDIKPVSASASETDAIRKKFRLLELHSGKFLRVNNIKVVEGYGYENAAAFSIGSVRYRIMDYINMTQVNERGHFISGMVNMNDLEKLLKSLKIKYNVATLRDQKIIFIPSKLYQKLLNTRQLSQINSYDLVIENTEEILDPSTAMNVLPFRSSLTSVPRKFEIIVETLGTIEPKLLLHNCFDNIRSRLETVSTNMDTMPDMITSVGTNTNVFIKGETHTIGEMLKHAIYDLDPSIPEVKTIVEHPSNRTIILSVNHTQPIKIIKDAIAKCIADLTTLESKIIKK